MTDRVDALIVQLERDIRDDDVQPLINAIMQMRGVLAITTNTGGNVSALVAEGRERRRIHDGLMELLYPKVST